MMGYEELIAHDCSAEEQEGYRNALLKFCEPDALAMMIYQHRQELLD